jgi:uncharacterized protein (DUF305 family)
MRRISMLLAVAMVALVVAGCSDEPQPPSAADTVFVQDMAVSASTTMDMADQARLRATDPDVRAMADTVYEAVVPVVDRLAELGPQLAADGADGFAHDDAVDHEEASANRATALRDASDREFDAKFLELVEAELRAGQAMAQTAQHSATDARTLGLADATIITWGDLISKVEGG